MATRRPRPPPKRRVKRPVRAAAKPQSLALVLRDPEQLMAAVQRAAPTKLALTGEPSVSIAAMGTLKLSDKQIKALRRKVEDLEVDWKPLRRDGPPEIPYLSHNGYRDRLDAAFGLGGWAMAPAGSPQEKDNVVYAPWALVIGGSARYYAWGEQAYDPKNRQMTYGDAIEGTKSSAIVRVGKELGIARDLWNRRYLAGLKRRVPISERLIGEEYLRQERAQEQETRPPATARTGWEHEKISDKQYGRLMGIMKKAGRPKIEVRKFILAAYGYQDGHAIQRKDYDAICAAVEKPGPFPTSGTKEPAGPPAREPDEILPPVSAADVRWGTKT